MQKNNADRQTTDTSGSKVTKMCKHNKGSALLSALFIMTLVAIVATAMSFRLQSDIEQAKDLIDNNKLYLASQAVTFWSMQVLSEHKTIVAKANTGGAVMSFPKKWNRIYPGVSISGEVFDLQARFNVNNLSDKAYHLPLLNLLSRLKLSLPPEANRDLLDELYLSINPNAFTNVKDQADLKQFNSAKHTSHAYRFVSHISEIRLLKMMTAKRYEKLSPLLTALPEVTPININTASMAILASLGKGLDASQRKQIIDARGKKGIKQLAKVNLILEKLHIPLNMVTVESKYFLSIAKAESPQGSLMTYTVLKREGAPPKPFTVSVIRESLNALD